MSSLRLALKQSLEEIGPQQPSKKRDDRRQKDSSRGRKRGEQRGPKKRGPGRPRKSSYQSPDHDARVSDGSSSSENEFSGSSDNDTVPAVDTREARASDSGDHDSDDGEDSVRRRKKIKKKRAIKRHRESAANRIQNQWKKKKGNQPAEASSSKQVKAEDHAGVRKPKSAERAKASSPTTGSGKAKTVPPPASDIVSYVGDLSIESQRKHLVAGLRVKVRFEMKKKRDGKQIRRRKWYGGLVTGVSKGGSKIRIKYDDGTTEVSKYPDEDVIVDAVGNGRHRVSGEFFLPPEMSSSSSSSSSDEESESPAPRYPTLQTNDDNKDSRDEQDDVKKSRKMTPASKNSTPKRKIPKVLHEDEESKESAKPDTPPDAPVLTPEIQPSKKTPSPVAGGAPVSHSPQSSEISDSQEVKEGAGDLVENVEHAEIMAGKLSKENLSTSKPKDEENESDQGRATLKASRDDSPRAKSIKVRKPSPAREAMPKKPTLTLRLKPPKARVTKINAGCLIRRRDDLEKIAKDGNSSAEEMSVDGMEPAAEAMADFGIAEEDQGTERGIKDSETKASDSDVLGLAHPALEANSPHQVSPLAGSKRPLPDDVDDGQPPAKKHTLESSDKDRKTSPLVPSNSVESSGSKDHTDKDISVGEKQRESDVASGREATTISTEMENATPTVDENALESHELSDSAKLFETKRTSPLESNGKQTEKQDNKGSSSPHDAELDRNDGPTSQAADSPTLLSVNPNQSSDEVKHPKPVPSVATPAKLDTREGDIKAKDDPILTASRNSAFMRKSSSISEEAELKLMPTSPSGSDEESASRAMTPVAREVKGSAVAVARSGRRAAQQANQRIASRQELVIQDPFAKAKKKRGKLDVKAHSETTGKRKYRRAERDDDDDGRHWVRCDNCQKWRKLPRTVETEKLPEHWYCEMNVYDSARNNCDAPEQKTEEETKKKKRKRGRPRIHTPMNRQESKDETDVPPLQETTSMESNADRVKRASSRSPSLEPTEVTGKVGRPLLEEATPKSKRSSPAFADRGSPQSDFDSVVKAGPGRKLHSVGTSSIKKTKSSDADEAMNNATNEESTAEVSAPKKRGRKKKDKSGKFGDKGKGGKASKDDDNQEWVQCEKCQKWRRLPPNISSEDLPEVWYCVMNTWDKASASCDVEEDKADPNVREYNIFGTGQSSYGTSGKLSYRNLIFARTGKRHNRPLSERTRAAESLFASITDEDLEGIGHPTVKYANSSAFAPRKSNTTTVDDTRRVSLFDLMNHSNLWAELRWGNNLGSGLSNGTGTKQNQQSGTLFDGLPTETKRSLKEIVFHALGTGTRAGHEVLLEAQCRQWEASPKQWEGLRGFCTLDVVSRMLVELVQDGLVEVVRDNDTQLSTVDKTPMYRRVANAALEPSSSTALASERARSRCMKISKPWKKRQ